MTRQRGFTLIELIAATALTAVLMVTLLRVTVSLARVQSAVRQAPSAEVWMDDLHQQIERDLRQARDVALVEQGIQMEGPIGSGWHGRRAHGPARVTYRVVTIHGTGLLVREELDLLDRSNRAARSQLMCAGVSRFEVEPVASRSGLDEATTPSNSNVDARRSQDEAGVPSAIRYRLSLTANPNQAIEREVALR